MCQGRMQGTLVRWWIPFVHALGGAFHLANRAKLVSVAGLTGGTRDRLGGAFMETCRQGISC